MLSDFMTPLPAGSLKDCSEEIALGVPVAVATAWFLK